VNTIIDYHCETTASKLDSTWDDSAAFNGETTTACSPS